MVFFSQSFDTVIDENWTEEVANVVVHVGVGGRAWWLGGGDVFHFLIEHRTSLLKKRCFNFC